MRARRMAVVSAVLSVGLIVASGGAAHGASADPAVEETVTLQLTSPDAAALRAAAQHAAAASVGLAQRQVGLAKALPTSAERDRVRQVLADRGLHVVDATAWSITARGSAEAVTGLVGSVRAHRLATPATALRPRSGPLAGLVSSVVGGDDSRRIARPLSVGPISGPGLRTAYDSPEGTPTTGSPLTVATLQLSGWDATDLTGYAADHGYPDPVGSGQYTAVSVDGADPSVPDGGGGDGEVALDQEALLAVAPHARQRAYFAPNTTQGFVDALNQVATDAMDATHDHYGLAALSISWGACEDDWGSDALAVDQALSHVLASGVTVFAASGDDGPYDCPDRPSAVTVDFPASDPLVVGVGGTTLDRSTLAEQAWMGSGGGISTHWLRPDYQSRIAAANTGRRVPDIALDADPASGFVVRYQSSYEQFGGTSLASPLAAGMLTDLLAARGFSRGVGSILPNLYGAPAGDFRDIKVGDNGVYFATTGYDPMTGLGAPLWSKFAGAIDAAPTVSLPRYTPTRTIPLGIHKPAGMQYVEWRAGLGGPPSGCDDTGATTTAPTTVTAPGAGVRTVWVLGFAPSGVCYLAKASTTVDLAAPSIHATIGLARPTQSRVLARWTGDDPQPGSGIGSYLVTISHLGGRAPDYSEAPTTETSHGFTSLEGGTYTVKVQARDTVGHTSTLKTAKMTVPIDDNGFLRTDRWWPTASPSAYEGGWYTTTISGATARRTAAGRTYTLLVTTCRGCGRAALYIDGHYRRTIDTYSSTTRTRVHYTVATFATRGVHTVSVRVLGTHDAHSNGNHVMLDGLIPAS